MTGVAWIPAQRPVFAPLAGPFDVREWGPASVPLPGDAIVLQPADLRLLTLREAIRLSTTMPFVRWIIAGELRDGGVGRIPPGSHAAVPTGETIDVEAIRKAVAGLTGLGLHHFGLDWRAGGVSERALDRLFAVPGIGPDLAEVSRLAKAPTSVITRAVMKAAGEGYAELRLRRALALIIACRAASDRPWSECAEEVGLTPRTSRRMARAADVPVDGGREELLASVESVLREPIPQAASH